jgi:uncharacterized membrane protein YdjX (TVP38/TMEM64 family)
MCAVPGIPTSVISVIVGLSYGPFLGTLINVLGNTCGNILSIALMQHIKLFDQSKKSNRWVKAIREMKHPKIGVMIGYMIPFIPSSLINFAATTLNLKIRDILLRRFNRHHSVLFTICLRGRSSFSWVQQTSAFIGSKCTLPKCT